MTRLLVIAVAGLAVSAAPPPTPDDLVREGAAALAAGDLVAADALLRHAVETADDPGLVAFARATVAARRGDWAAAELGYTQALDDPDCSPRRRAEAGYNRGVCLLHRGGQAAVYRTAVDLFARAADELGDDPLAADARHNRELAKLLWNRARERDRPPPAPADDPPALPPSASSSPGSADPGDELAGGPGGRPSGAGRPGPRGDPGGADAGPTPGAGPLPVLADADAVQPLSPADTRGHLRAAADRLARDRRDNARLRAGPERPHVPDW